MTTIERTSTTTRRHVRSSVLLGLIAPLVFTIIASLIAWSWRGDLPDPVAQHWGPGGVPDGFGSLTTVLAVGLIGTVVAAVAFTLLAIYSPAGRRLAIGTSWGVAGLFSTIILGTLAIQRGLEDASEATEVGWMIGLALIVMLVLAFCGYLLSPRDERVQTSAPLPASATRNAISLSDGERVAWHGTIGAGSGLYVGLLSIVLTSVLVFMTSMWAIVVIPVILMFLVASFSMFRVKVNARGVKAQSIMGWLGKEIPLETISQATVTETNPLKEFGGWGWRVGRNNTTGIVTRKGESLTVEHSGDQRFVMTLDDAASAAAAINGLIARERGVAS